jgi:peptide/nickel transport system substrate-binding protein
MADLPGATRAVALAATLLAGATGARAAGFVDPNPLPPDTMTERMREPGVYGGRFVIGQTAGPRTFNALVANEQNSNEICDRLYVSLTDFDNPSQRDLPGAARSWTWSADRRTLTFHLRRGMRFSDGHPLTADDVKFSFDVALDESLPTVGKDGLSSVDPVTGKSTPYRYRVLDSLTFAVTVPRPSAMLLNACGSVRIMPKHVLEGPWKAGQFAAAYGTGTPPEQIVTSGPWRIQQYLPGQSVVLTRNPWWFGVDARGRRLPYLDQLVYLIVSDQNAAALKFRAGELDAVDNVRPEDYPGYQEAQQREHFTLYDIGPSLNTNFLWFNLNLDHSGAPAVGAVKYAWFSNPVFRRAVSLAIDRGSLIRGPFRGYAVKNWSLLTAGNRAWHDSTITRYDYNPAAARRLLAGLGLRDRNGDGVLEDAAGHPVSFAVITNTDNTVRKDMLTLVTDDLAKVGIRITAAPIEMSTLVQHIRGDFQYDACLLGLGAATPPDPGMYPNVVRSSGLSHYWHIRQEKPSTPEEVKLDQLFQQNLDATDLAARRRSYHEIAELMARQQWLVWLPTQLIRVPVRSKFGNIQPTIVPQRVIWNSDRLFVRPGAD